jgi:hypothetical protein
MGANIPSAAANIPQAEGSSLTTALNEQLGLKLEAVRVPVDGVSIFTTVEEHLVLKLKNGRLPSTSLSSIASKGDRDPAAADVSVPQSSARLRRSLPSAHATPQQPRAGAAHQEQRARFRHGL